MKNTKRLALAALMSALGVAVMYAGCLLEILDLSTAAIASMCVLLVLVETGAKYAWLTYAVSATLSLILLPIKTAGLIFVGFFGFYPMAKAFFERRFCGWRCLALKILLLNVSTAVMLLLVRYVIAEALWFEILTLVLANIVFVVYDYALTNLLRAYVFVWRKKLRIKF